MYKIYISISKTFSKKKSTKLHFIELIKTKKIHYIIKKIFISIRAGSNLEVATFEAQTFITFLFKNLVWFHIAFKLVQAIMRAQVEICV